MRLFCLPAVLLAVAGGCSRPVNNPPSASVPSDTQGTELHRQRGSRDDPRVMVQKLDRRPPFDDKEMSRPITEYHGYTIEDYRDLPNCLDVFTACTVVPFEGKTSAQYKSALQEVAQKPCRVVLSVVNVSSDYDYADFRILTDGGESGWAVLKQGGNWGNYSRHVQDTFAINDVKAKGLDANRRSIGDRVVLVGLGYVVPASPWGAASPRYGMPRGDERQVMLRAFGKPGGASYEFSFMVRNWYIAAQ